MPTIRAATSENKTVQRRPCRGQPISRERCDALLRLLERVERDRSQPVAFRIDAAYGLWRVGLARKTGRLTCKVSVRAWLDGLVAPDVVPPPVSPPPVSPPPDVCFAPVRVELGWSELHAGLRLTCATVFDKPNGAFVCESARNEVREALSYAAGGRELVLEGSTAGWFGVALRQAIKSLQALHDQVAVAQQTSPREEAPQLPPPTTDWVRGLIERLNLAHG